MSTPNTTPLLSNSTREKSSHCSLADGRHRMAVIADRSLNILVVFVAIVGLAISKDEITTVPLRLWIVVYAVQCIVHVVCAFVDDYNVCMYTTLVVEVGNKMLSFIWWIIGFYWLVPAWDVLQNDAPTLSWLTFTFILLKCLLIPASTIVSMTGINAITAATATNSTAAVAVTSPE